MRRPGLLAKAREHASSPKCNVRRRCCQGGHQYENAHESNNNGAHIWKLEYQGYDVRVVLVKLVLYVVSRGRAQSKTAPKADRAAVMHGDAAAMHGDAKLPGWW